MDSNFKNIKCPNCGALMNLVNDTYTCDYCDSKFTNAEYNSYISKTNIDIDTTGIGDGIEISKVIPFKKTKEDFYKIINSKVKGKLFIPLKVKKIKLEDIKQIYVPYYVFDIKTNGDTVLKCTDISKKVKDDNKVINIKTFKTTVNSNCDFIKLPICASTEFDDSIIDFIEPFNVSESVDLNPSIDNNLLIKSDVTLKDAINLASLKCRKKVNDLVIKKTEHKISEISQSHVKYSIINETLVNFPVIFVKREYKGKEYVLSMNGSNGKYDINFPVSSFKVVIYTLLFVSVVFTLVLLLTLHIL